MAAYSRRGFRVRLILEDYDDHRKKCYFFVNVLREKLVRNVVQRIWHFFYQDICSTPDQLFLEIDEFFIPAGESTLVLKENDVISVRLKSQPAGSRTVRSTVAPLTDAPGTLVESVALVLRRLQDGTGPDDAERSERHRLTKVAEMMAAESASTDVSTDEEDVRHLADQLTSGQEVVRLSQKMADQATPPPPCAARNHDLDPAQLSLTETSRELRRRYEAARRPPAAAPAPAPAAAPALYSPVRTRDALDWTASQLAVETPTAAAQNKGAVTSTPRTAVTAAAAGVSTLDGPTRGRGAGEGAATSSQQLSVPDAARRHPARVKIVTVVPGAAARSSAPSGSAGALGTAPGAPIVKIVTQEDAKKRNNDVIIVTKKDAKKTSKNTASEGSQAVKVMPPPVPLTIVKIAVPQQQKPPPVTVTRDTTPAKRQQKPLDRDEKTRHAPLAGLKRARSPSSASSSAESSSEEDSSVKSTPAKKSATPPAAASGEVSAEKKKKTRTRRRRGKKHRTPEAPLAPPPPPQPRPGNYAQRHGLPRNEIDRYKRAASVGIGWQTRPKNRRVVFDDDGNPVVTGAEPAAAAAEPGAAATGRRWRAAPAETGCQSWAWSQGRRDEQGTGGGWSRPDDSKQNARDPSGNFSVTEERSSNVLATAERPGNPTSTENGPEIPTRSADNSRPATPATAAASTPTFRPPAAPSHAARPAIPAVTPTTASLSPGRAGEQPPPSRLSGEASREEPARGAGRKSGPLGAGLLPRAFMRPLRCIDAPRRAEVLRLAPAAAAETEGASGGGSGVMAAGSGKLLQPAYLLASRAASASSAAAAAAVRGTKSARAGVTKGSSVAGTCGRHLSSDGGDGTVSSGASGLSTSSLPAQESSRGQTPCRVQSVTPSTSAPTPAAVSVPPSAAAAVAPCPAPPVSLGTVVLDGSGRPADGGPSDLRQLASSGERRPLVVVRRHRPLPGRAPYRELTRQQHPGTAPGTDSATNAAAGTDSVTDGAAGTDTATDGAGTAADAGGAASCWRDGGGGASRARQEDGDGGGRGAVVLGDAGEGTEDAADADSSASSDVYRNVSVILSGPPLETLSPRVGGSEGSPASSEEDSEDSESEYVRDSEDEVTGVGVDEHLNDTSARTAGASWDGIDNCNVVNVVGQNRRLEKQRARGLPPGGDKENQAPTDVAKDDKFYAQFPLMKEGARKHDLIAFKCWDMAADYSPYVSEYREATVMDVTDGRLTLQLLEYRPHARRRGRFEISTPDDDEVVDLEEESGIEQKRWSELIQPRLLHP